MQGVDFPAGEADIVDAAAVSEGVAPVAALEVYQVVTDACPLHLLSLLPEGQDAVA